jgi:hypothetical protein
LGLTAAGRELDKPMQGTIESAVERLLASTDYEEIVIARRMLDTLAGLLTKEVDPSHE